MGQVIPLFERRGILLSSPSILASFPHAGRLLQRHLIALFMLQFVAVFATTDISRGCVFDVKFYGAQAEQK
jgi:hypothetical protein